jgi:hypothetical protein
LGGGDSRCSGRPEELGGVSGVGVGDRSGGLGELNDLGVLDAKDFTALWIRKAKS